MIATYTSKNYSPEKVWVRYVMCSVDGTYRFCEVGSDRRYDLRQGIVDPAELPAHIRRSADERRGTWPAYVVWP